MSCRPRCIRICAVVTLRHMCTTVRVCTLCHMCTTMCFCALKGWGVCWCALPVHACLPDSLCAVAAERCLHLVVGRTGGRVGCTSCTYPPPCTLLLLSASCCCCSCLLQPLLPSVNVTTVCECALSGSACGVALQCRFKNASARQGVCGERAKEGECCGANSPAPVSLVGVRERACLHSGVLLWGVWGEQGGERGRARCRAGILLGTHMPSKNWWLLNSTDGCGHVHMYGAAWFCNCNSLHHRQHWVYALTRRVEMAPQPESDSN